MKAFIKLIRIKQWIKNTFLFIPTFFAGNLFNVHNNLKLLLGFLAFSLIASSVYIINDYRDRHVDRLHPKKKLRPIASGAIGETTALIIFFALVVLGLSLAFTLDNRFLILLSVYLSINILYSFGLKNISILDLFIVASGFIIRVYSGGVITDTPISQWLFIMILLLALFLVLAKRRDDLFIQGETGTVIRKTSTKYNLEFVNSCLTMFSAVVVVAYIMYTVSDEVTARFESGQLYITTVFVLAGIMRYLQITFVEQDSGSPTTILFKDKFIIFTILGWIMSFYLIIYAS